MANPNLLALTNVFGKSYADALNTTYTSQLSNALNSDKVFKVNAIIVANTSGSQDVDVDVSYYNHASQNTAYFAESVLVPAGATIVVIGREAAFYMQEGDQIFAIASDNNRSTIMISYEELS